MRVVRWVAGAAFVCGMVGCGGKETPPPEPIRPLKVMLVGDAGGTGERQFPGSVEAATGAELTFEVAGRLVELPVEEGDKVVQGQLIAKLDAADFRNRLASERAQALKAEQDYKRAQELYANRSVSLADFQSNKAAHEVARASVATAAKALNDTQLRAPFTGTIAQRQVDNFQNVAAGAPIVVLEDNTQLEVRIFVPESTVLRARGAATEFDLVATFEAAPGREFPLTLVAFATRPDPATRTYPLRLALPEKLDLSVLPGMSCNVIARPKLGADAEVPEDQTADFLVPSAAIIGDAEGQAFAWRVADDLTVSKVPVSLGEMHGDSVLITDGLESGWRIAAAGANFLVEGQKVREFESKGTP